MSALDHWHPVVTSCQLTDKPTGIVLDGHEIVLFRTADGQIGALADSCCHRGMRLSKGWVEGCELVCPYHGWKYRANGTLTTASIPRETHATEVYATAERDGLVWVKRAASPRPLPEFDDRGFAYVGTLHFIVDAPLEVTVDNFTEVEHTGVAHAYFGYAFEDVPSIHTEVDLSDDEVIVRNRGIQRPFPRIIYPFVGFRPGDYFHNDWVTRFSPVHTVYDQKWTDPHHGVERKQRLRIAIYYNPISDLRTQLIIPIYARPFLGRFLFRYVVRHIIAWATNYEIGLDKKIIEDLADKSPSLRGMRLGRFDRPLNQQRKRIDRIYWGREDARPPSHPEPESTGSDILQAG